MLFPENLNVPTEKLRLEGKKLTVFRGASLYVICYIAGNSLNPAVTPVVGQHSRVTVHCYSLTS